MSSKNSRIDTANEVFWNSISEIQGALSLSDEKLADIAGIKTRTFRSLRSKNQSIKLPQLCSICDEFDIDSLKLFRGEVDISVLKSHMNGNHDVVPEKYLLCPNSKAFTSKRILDKIREYNPGVERSILKSLQMKKLSLLNEDFTPVSVELSSEIVKLANFVFPNELYYEWGKENAFQLKDGLFGRTLARARNVVELFEMWLHLELHIEKNWNYQIAKNDGKTVVINSYPTEEMTHFHKKISYTNIQLSWFRAGFASALPNYIGMNDADVTLTKSVHEGDDFCQFVVNIDNSRLPSLHRPPEILH